MGGIVWAHFVVGCHIWLLLAFCYVGEESVWRHYVLRVEGTDCALSPFGLSCKIGLILRLFLYCFYFLVFGSFFYAGLVGVATWFHLLFATVPTDFFLTLHETTEISVTHCHTLVEWWLALVVTIILVLRLFFEGMLLLRDMVGLMILLIVVWMVEILLWLWVVVIVAVGIILLVGVIVMMILVVIIILLLLEYLLVIILLLIGVKVAMGIGLMWSFWGLWEIIVIRPH